MEKQKSTPNSKIPLLLSAILTVLLIAALAGADWLKMSPPPDVDKVDHNDVNPGGTDARKPTCWIAVASNMLAGAGYGDGSSVQERADSIYTDLCLHLVDGNDTGWADTALDEWLSSEYNTDTSNPYTVVTVHGRTYERYPWANANLPKFVGNALRDCNYVRLSIREPTCDSNVGKGGHAITLWGDDSDASELTGNPDKVKVSDSDYWNFIENVQTYTYDDFNDPNPDGCDEGNGWYIDYKNNHWYIDDILTLTPVTDGNVVQVQKLVGSLKVQYTGDVNAERLDYKISTDANKILSYRTDIDWDTDNAPDITEDTNELDVEWDLSDNNVPKNTWVTITAELVVPYNVNGDSISISNIVWYPLNLTPVAGVLWRGMHSELGGGHTMYAPNVCGGYVVSDCNIYKEYPAATYTLLGKYRHQFQYKYYQDPESHDLFFEPEMLPPPDPPGAVYVMGDFRFGHSYGLLLDDELWQYDGPWRTIAFDYQPYPALTTQLFQLRWPDELPYPQGQDFTNPEPNECGDRGTYYYAGDVNKDCRVDFEDFRLFALGWMGCTDPQDANCM